ncbi:MAG: hypothetical protein CVV23_04780 [Ignavibacteriae bacterium HGW-Ignavibacteriae-2]|jgi:hypothetical protein|nr:MAG: hypothetical protein CVV23_04780 [Ignavibacteriae bacterium HGW-Ignavibacteriae-2]
MRLLFWGSLLVIGIIGLSSCDFDDFLFNEKELSKYQLPGNKIPETKIEEAKFKSGDNTLFGYWIKSNGAEPNITLLYCHGNKYNIDNYWDRVNIFYELGVNVFIFDYRGFGMSEGKSSEKSLYEDAEAALDYILSRKEVERDSICFYGYSLGNVASIQLAADVFNPLCLVAESPFASANSLTQSSLVLDIPEGWLTEGKYDNAEKIKYIHTPFLLIHGEDDDFVRYKDNGKIVFNNAPNPKKLLLIPGANHTDIPYKTGKEKYLNELGSWIKFAKSAK